MLCAKVVVRNCLLVAIAAEPASLCLLLPCCCCCRVCRLVLRYFQHAPAPFQYLTAAGGACASAGGLPAGQLARSTLRGLQLLPQLQWPVAAALPAVLQHPDADVRWCAAECAALAFGLQDASRGKVRAVQ